MRDVVDLDRYPLDRPGSPDWRRLVERCSGDLADRGMVDLPGFLRPEARTAVLAEVAPRIGTVAFRHARRHNIDFSSTLPLPEGHPALAEVETVSRTLCADQLGASPLVRLHGWEPFAAFLAAIMGQERLFPMADPLARANVMPFGPGEGLNGHVYRSEFTTTLLLQAPEAGGSFVYRRDLRSEEDPNDDGVARPLRGEEDAVRRVAAEAGTLMVFRGRNTAHRVTPVEGGRPRLVAVFSFFDRDGVMFTPEERIAFYGRAA